MHQHEVASGGSLVHQHVTSEGALVHQHEVALVHQHVALEGSLVHQLQLLYPALHRPAPTPHQPYSVPPPAPTA